MKPNFALTLSFEGISLLHRSFPGWKTVGDVALDTTDLAGALSQLRDSALQLDSGELRSKLVLPDDQVKYLTIAIADDSEAAARAALESATPYAVDDLAYDWIVKDDKIAIAAVAKETLAEAEAFAKDHQFNPVSFVSRPTADQYPGEPFFGVTQSFLEQGGAETDVEADAAPIRVIGAAATPSVPAASDTATPPDETDAHAPSDEAWPELENELDAEFAREGDAALDEALTRPEAAADDAAASDATAENAPVPPPTDAELDETLERELAQDTANELAPEAISEETGPTEPGKPISEPEPSAPSENDAEASPSDAAKPAPVAAFASIRASRAGSMAPAAPTRLDGVTRDTPAPRVTLSATREDSVPDAAAPVTGRSDVALNEGDVTADEIRPVAEDRLAQPGPLAEQPFAPEPRSEPTPEAPPPLPEPEPAQNEELPDFEQAYAAARAEPDPIAGPEPRGQQRQGSPLSFFTRRARQPVPAASGAAALTTADDERDRMTIFGAREKAPVGGKPRFLGLILTAVLLLFLIGVAAWASIFLDDGIARFFREDDSPVLASPPPPEIEDDAAVELAALQPEAPLPVLEDPATAILSRVSPADLSPDEAMARYAATGIWQLAPEPPAESTARELEEFYQTSLDPDPDFGDAVALPTVTAAFSDGIFFTPAPPPAADTIFTLDARGFVQATPEGALTPDGVRVFAGLPAVTIPAAVRRGAVQEDVQPEAPEATSQLALLRPRARPADLAEQIERSALGGRTLGELASLRPKLRPESAQEAAEAARKAAELAAAQAEAAAAAQASTANLQAVEEAVAEAVNTPDPFAGATSQAVRASLKPNTRPSNFNAIVRRAERQQAQAEAEPVRVAAAQRVTPNIPTAASVAKAATERNALKFQRVNLIGVYGTTSNRRALVRMSNGRYRKVQVGDRLDGGKVSAIGDGELRYIKGGRNIVLKMPRG